MTHRAKIGFGLFGTIVWGLIKYLFSKKMKMNAKNWILKILALSVENCGFQGKNRGLVIAQSTLGWGLFKKLII
jgi:hypothetical protein